MIWTYGQEEAEEKNLQMAKDEQTIQKSFSTENLNFGYKISGKSEVKPSIVFDDGEKIYIKFDKLPKKLPTLFIKERGKKGVMLANYSLQGSSYVLERLADEIELRNSEKEVIKIKRIS